MDFDESVRYMSGLLRFGWKLGNERFEALCDRLGNPHLQLPAIHVAGTKGKGSTTALAAAILKESGFHVGAYFSPYVFDIRERAQIDGRMISREEFARIASLIRPHMEALAQTEHGETTEFEMKTALAFRYFADNRVDWACVEVGLGGRLDATNVVRPAVTVITNIGLDHTNVLGTTHAEIAGEKAGIVKPGVVCITATDHPEALAVIRSVANERGAPLARVAREGDDAGGSDRVIRWETAPDAGGLDPEGHFARVTVRTARREYPDLDVAMAGIYQRINAACAIAAVEEALGSRGLELELQHVRRALAETLLPGRMSVQRLASGVLLVLDGAHNALAADALAGTICALRRREALRDTWLVIGMLEGHDPAGVLAPLASGATVIACQPDWRRALPAETIAEAARPLTDRVEIVRSVPEAVESAITRAQPNDLILVTGSFYTIGETEPIQLRDL
jgi:dihydrofolate synthase/folylpolyglutamate synthase